MGNEKTFVVVIPDPLSVNSIYATDWNTGRRYMTATYVKNGKEIEGGKQYAGYIKVLPANSKRDKELKEFIPGRLDECFKAAGLPVFTPRHKVVIDAYATWPNEKPRDMSNLQKPIEDALQKGGYVTNDCWILWRNIDFEYGDRHELRLEIYEV